MRSILHKQYCISIRYPINYAHFFFSSALSFCALFLSLWIYSNRYNHPPNVKWYSIEKQLNHIKHMIFIMTHDKIARALRLMVFFKLHLCCLYPWDILRFADFFSGILLSTATVSWFVVFSLCVVILLAIYVNLWTYWKQSAYKWMVAWSEIRREKNIYKNDTTRTHWDILAKQ